MQNFSQFRLDSHNLMVGFVASQGLTGYAHTVVALLLPMNYT